MCLFDLATVQGNVHKKVTALVCVGSAVSTVSFPPRVTEGKSPWLSGTSVAFLPCFRTFIAIFLTYARLKCANNVAVACRWTSLSLDNRDDWDLPPDKRSGSSSQGSCLLQWRRLILKHFRTRADCRCSKTRGRIKMWVPKDLGVLSLIFDIPCRAVSARSFYY